MILVILLHVVFVKFGGLLAINGKEVSAGIFGPQRFDKLLEGGMEAYHRSDILWQVQLSSGRTIWGRAELELVPFP